jgi:hypothetical protein
LQVLWGSPASGYNIDIVAALEKAIAGKASHDYHFVQAMPMLVAKPPWKLQPCHWQPHAMLM